MCVSVVAFVVDDAVVVDVVVSFEVETLVVVDLVSEQSTGPVLQYSQSLTGSFNSERRMHCN